MLLRGLELAQHQQPAGRMRPACLVRQRCLRVQTGRFWLLLVLPRQAPRYPHECVLLFALLHAIAPTVQLHCNHELSSLRALFRRSKHKNTEEKNP